MAVLGTHAGCRLTPPINTHIGHAFLVNCRKMYEFFVYEPVTNPKHEDIRALHFMAATSTPVVFALPQWWLWHDAMNKQLLHVTFARVTKPMAWNGHDENALFLQEFTAAWKVFREHLDEPYKPVFEAEITKKLESEFKGLDLH